MALKKMPWLKAEHERASVRAKAEHQFHIVKNLFGFHNVWYRGIPKNRSLLFILFASANLVLCSRKAVVQQGVTRRFHILISRGPLQMMFQQYFC